MTPAISSDTQVVLLLMARLTVRSDTAADPLTHGEFNRLALAMAETGLRPADLLSAGAHAFIAEQTTIDSVRLRRLLERSMSLAVATEGWTNAGFWILSRADEEYPRRLRERLKGKAPVLLFGCGDTSLLDAGGLAVIGSRNVDQEGAAFTADAAKAAAAEGIQVISGGARGVDSIAMESALERGGNVTGVLANDLAKTSRSASAREAISDGRLCLVSPSQPEARFEAWRAMDRNKSIYALSDWALVIASDLRKGGTWAGAKENLDQGWVPLFVRSSVGAPAGNTALVDMGGRAVDTTWFDDLASRLESPSEVAPEEGRISSEPQQESLF